MSLAQTMTTHPAYDGKPAKVFELSNVNGMKVTFMDIGATWLSCKLPLQDKEREVLLGVSNMPDFEAHNTYLGATVGRFANRIAGGKFSIAGRHYQTEVNQGDNILHGGPDGFNRRRWSVITLTESCVEFALTSPDGDQGFPGELQVKVKYLLTKNNELFISYCVETDQATPLNLTNHAYFNLENAEQGSDCRNHTVKINAKQYLPTDDQGIPLGHFANVENSSFDFTKHKAIDQDFLSDEQQIAAKGYDHSFIFDSHRSVEEPVAELRNRDNSITVQVFTDMPAMQFYTGNWNEGTPNRVGGTYQDYSAIALETQLLPDAPNHPEWPMSNAILQPGELFQSTTCYKFFC